MSKSNQVKKNIKEYKKILKDMKVKSVSKERLQEIAKEIERDSRKVTQIPQHVLDMRFYPRPNK